MNCICCAGNSILLGSGAFLGASFSVSAAEGVMHIATAVTAILFVAFTGPNQVLTASVGK